MKKIEITTMSKNQFLNITNAVQDAVFHLGITNGVVTAYTPHTTCGMTINENADPDVLIDLLGHLDRAVPWNAPEYRHRGGNAAAHIKASLMGSSVSIIVECSKLKLGIWQAIYLCEFDGPRARDIWIG